MTMTFEEQYQAHFAPTAEKYPVGTEVFAKGKVYKVVDYVGYGDRYGVVGVDREGNEKELFDVEPLQYKVCGRCGGSGRFSYNMTHGSTCYGCSGIGKNLLAPKGFEQKIKAVCTTDLNKFGFVEGDELKAEFCGFSQTGGTPRYKVTNKRTNVGNILLYSRILDHFEVK